MLFVLFLKFFSFLLAMASSAFRLNDFCLPLLYLIIDFRNQIWTGNQQTFFTWLVSIVFFFVLVERCRIECISVLNRLDNSTILDTIANDEFISFWYAVMFDLIQMNSFEENFKFNQSINCYPTSVTRVF